ncbi:MAG: flagellar hook-basal body complex protein, partial [Candidatus Margulisiibacteriota bacterium]
MLLKRQLFFLPLIFLAFIVPGFSNEDVIYKLAPELKNEEYVYEQKMENIVNMQTPGYKELKSVALIDLNGKRKNILYRDFKAGPLARTGESMDLAIEGEGFFVLDTPMGMAYTRDGRFVLDRNGRVLTRANFYPVMADNGGLTLPDQDVVVNQKGEIYKLDQQVGKFKVVVIKNQK